MSDPFAYLVGEAETEAPTPTPRPRRRRFGKLTIAAIVFMLLCLCGQGIYSTWPTIRSWLNLQVAIRELRSSDTITAWDAANYLMRDGGKPARSALLAATGDGNSTVRMFAFQSLVGWTGTLGPEAVQPALAGVADENPSIRQEATTLLFRLSNEGLDVTPGFLRVLNDRDTMTRQAAARGLWQHPSVNKLVMERLSTSFDPVIRKVAIMRLRHELPMTANDLWKFLEDRDPNLRHIAADGLLQYLGPWSPDVVGVYLDALGDGTSAVDDPEIDLQRKWDLDSLLYHADEMGPDERSKVFKALERTDPETRRHAVGSIWRHAIKHGWGVRALENARDDDDPIVRRLAEIALDDIEGGALGPWAGVDAHLKRPEFPALLRRFIEQKRLMNPPNPRDSDLGETIAWDRLMEEVADYMEQSEPENPTD